MLYVPYMDLINDTEVLMYNTIVHYSESSPK